VTVTANRLIVVSIAVALAIIFFSFLWIVSGNGWWD
jgi:hypothetical protein